ncbi:PLP-dependent transferase [Amphibiibacter pelophylacis]|uniref:PLP-dependent transferase n=1 Tax=Amphibiibacter pelophylacis TaxID=1799477 RepID=A0ACC6P1P4_9BURK
MSPDSTPEHPRDLSTRLIHPDYQPPDGFEAVQPPVHKACSVLFPDMASVAQRRWTDRSSYTYGLHGTPTTYRLEAQMAQLEGAQHALLCPSGLMPIALVNLTFLKPGDAVLLPDNAYGSGRDMAWHWLRERGVRVDVYEPMDVAAFSAALTPQTRVVWLEAAGSITMEFPDLPALVAATRAHEARHGRVIVALDNTWGAGLAFNAFEAGADVSVHAMTKYPSGGADVLMGAVVTRDDALHRSLQRTHMHLGVGVGGNDAELVLRSLPTMSLRYDAQDRAARHLARWLAQQPQIERVLHPALPSGVGHEHWQALCGVRDRAAGIFSFTLDERYSAGQADALVDALQLFGIAYSWGGPMSLAMRYDLSQTRSHALPWRGVLIRLAIGLEDVADLQADLAQALARLG